MKQVLITSVSLVFALNVFAADDSGMSSATGMEASRSELSPRTNIQFYKRMAESVKTHGSKLENRKVVIQDDGKGVGNVYVEKGKNVVNITEVKKGAVIIQK